MLCLADTYHDLISIYHKHNLVSREFTWKVIKSIAHVVGLRRPSQIIICRHQHSTLHIRIMESVILLLSRLQSDLFDDCSACNKNFLRRFLDLRCKKRENKLDNYRVKVQKYFSWNMQKKGVWVHIQKKTASHTEDLNHLQCVSWISFKVSTIRKSITIIRW